MSHPQYSICCSVVVEVLKERDVIIDETEIWNPNELIDQIKATESEEEKLKLKRELIDKFLTQQRPMLTAKMKDFLVEDGENITYL